MTAAVSWLLTSKGNRTPGATIPATDRGVRYGMSVFETVAWTGTKLLFGREHLDRLRQTAGAAAFPFPDYFSGALLDELAGELPATTGVIRLYLTAGDGGPLDLVTEARAFVLFEAAGLPTVGDLQRGYSLQTSAAAVPCILGGWKTANYWPNIHALAEARHQGADEALVFNATGALVSAAMGNVFLVLDGRLMTPARETGARDGVVRAWVRSQVPVEESLLTADDIARAEECFVTNSRIGVMPVTAIDGRRLSSRMHADHLASLYRQATT